MANVKISELAAAIDITGAEQVPVVQGGTTKRTTAAALVAPHEADTTAVHGIADTAALVLTGDARLSDARIPTDLSVTNAKVSATAAIAKSKLAALAIVNADVDAAAAIAETKLALASDAVAGTASRRTLGTGATQAAAGDHAHSGTTGAPVVIAEQTLAVAAAYIEFAAISQSYRHLQIEGRLRSERSGQTDDVIFLRCGNGSLDTGANYAFLITTSVTVDTNSTGATAIQIGRCAGATAPTDTFSDFSCTIHDYKTTTWWRTMRASTMQQLAANLLTESLGHWQNKAAAIDIIRLYPATGPNFIAGSQLRLIGVPAP